MLPRFEDEAATLVAGAESIHSRLDAEEKLVTAADFGRCRDEDHRDRAALSSNRLDRTGAGSFRQPDVGQDEIGAVSLGLGDRAATAAAKAIAQTALERGSMDNITVVVMTLLR